MCARPRKSDDEACARRLRDALGELRPFIDQCKTAIVESARAAGHENPVLSKVPARARASPRVPLPLRGKTLDGARCSRAPLRSQDLLALVGAGEMQTPHIDLAPGQLQAIMAPQPFPSGFNLQVLHHVLRSSLTKKVIMEKLALPAPAFESQ